MKYIGLVAMLFSALTIALSWSDYKKGKIDKKGLRTIVILFSAVLIGMAVLTILNW